MKSFLEHVGSYPNSTFHRKLPNIQPHQNRIQKFSTKICSRYVYKIPSKCSPPVTKFNTIQNSAISTNFFPLLQSPGAQSPSTQLLHFLKLYLRSNFMTKTSELHCGIFRPLKFYPPRPPTHNKCRVSISCTFLLIP